MPSLFNLCTRSSAVLLLATLLAPRPSNARAYCNLTPPQAVFSSGGKSPTAPGTGSGGGGPGGGGGDGGGGAGGGGGGVVCAEDRVFGTWYAGWHASEFPPEKVSWSKYTHVTYSFA
jgi:chitinase